MLYAYLAYTTAKEVVSGRIEAVSELAAEEVLYGRGLHRVLSLKEVRSGPSVEELLPTIYAVKPREIIDFFRQLATLLESGIAIYTALNLLRLQTSGQAMKKVIAGLSDEVREGGSFSQAMAKYPKVFSSTYVQAVRASEHSGNLEYSLRHMATHIEKREGARQKVGRAFVYPSLVLVMAIGVIVLLMMVVLPPVTGLYQSLGAELPGATRLLISVSNFFVSYSLHLLVAVLALALLLPLYLRSPVGRLARDRAALRLPVIGTLNVQRHMFRLCQTAAMLLRAGVLLPRVLDTLVQSSPNIVIRQAVEDVREKLIQGQGLTAPLAENPVFPKLLTEMVAIGEISGTLDGSLATLADYYEQRVDQQVQSLIGLTEPVLTLVVGLLVVFIALATVMPLYSVMGSFS